MTKDILDFISKTLRRHMAANDLSFTDFEKAGLIYNSPLLPEEKYRRLEALAAETADENLKSQIATRLQVEREDIAAFKNDAEGYVYAVNSYEYGDNREPFTCGYFAYFEPAFEHGKRQGHKFEIEKYRIVGCNGTQPLKSRLYFRSIADRDEIKESASEQMKIENNDCDYEDVHYPDGRFQYDKNGTLLSYLCVNVKRDEREVMSLLWDTNRFENAFIFMPNPFELGDIVIDTEFGEAGIVAISQKDQNSFHERIRSGELTGSDFSDASITVDFLWKDGSFFHGHVNPAFLEKYEPKEGNCDYMVLTAASELCRGIGRLERFSSACDLYRWRQEEHRQEQVCLLYSDCTANIKKYNGLGGQVHNFLNVTEVPPDLPIQNLKRVHPFKQKTVVQIIEELFNKNLLNKIESIILFGSSITEACGIKNDLDIAFKLLPDEDGLRDTKNLVYDIVGKYTDWDFDLFFLDRFNPDSRFYKNIMEGVTLYQKGSIH